MDKIIDGKNEQEWKIETAYCYMNMLICRGSTSWGARFLAAKQFGVQEYDLNRLRPIVKVLAEKEPMPIGTDLEHLERVRGKY